MINKVGRFCLAKGVKFVWLFHHITFQFENGGIKDEGIRVDRTLFNQIEIGDTCTITFQNGFFNIPIIKDKSFD